MAMVARGAWRKIYWHLFFAGSLYLLAYQWLNAALGREQYYSGSIYDSGLRGHLLVHIDCLKRTERALGTPGGGDAGTLGRPARVSCRACSAVLATDRLVRAIFGSAGQPIAAVPRDSHGQRNTAVRCVRLPSAKPAGAGQDAAVISIAEARDTRGNEFWAQSAENCLE